MFTGNDMPGLGWLFAVLIGIGVAIGVVSYWLVSWLLQHLSISWN